MAFDPPASTPTPPLKSESRSPTFERDLSHQSSHISSHSVKIEKDFEKFREVDDDSEWNPDSQLPRIRNSPEFAPQRSREPPRDPRSERGRDSDLRSWNSRDRDNRSDGVRENRNRLDSPRDQYGFTARYEPPPARHDPRPPPGHWANHDSEIDRDRLSPPSFVSEREKCYDRDDHDRLRHISGGAYRTPSPRYRTSPRRDVDSRDPYKARDSRDRTPPYPSRERSPFSEEALPQFTPENMYR